MQDHNWKEKKFGDAYKVQSGFAFKTDAFVSDPVKGVAIIRMNNLKSGRVSRDNVVYIDVETNSGKTSWGIQFNFVLYNVNNCELSWVKWWFNDEKSRNKYLTKIYEKIPRLDLGIDDITL